MDTAAIYCRLSDEDKNKNSTKDESESIQNQKNLLIEYAAKRGWNIYKIYSDDDYSGHDIDRPEFNSMIRDAEKLRFNIVLCKTQSRFTRDMEIAEKYLHNKFLEWGIRFITAVDGVDNFDKHGKKSRQINGLINEWYSEDLSESIKAVFRIKQRDGKFIGSFSPYGYKKDEMNKNRIIIDEEAAEVIKYIFRLYLDGYGTLKIAEKLNNMSIPGPAEYKRQHGYNFIGNTRFYNSGGWSRTAVKRILKDEVYIGNMVQHKFEKSSYKTKLKRMIEKEKWIIAYGTHEPIIDRKTYDLVQVKMKNKTRSCGTGKPHIFAGHVRCMGCGSTMIKNSNGKGSEYLRCSNSIGGKAVCSSHSIRIDKLSETVGLKLREHLMELDVQGIVDKVQKLEINSSNSKLNYKTVNRIYEEIELNKQAVKCLYLDRAKGVIKEDVFIELMNRLHSDREVLTNKKNELEKEFTHINDILFDIDKLRVKIQEGIALMELTSGLIEMFIDGIEIGEKNVSLGEQQIKIHWNF